jgi:hypothetical protein
VPNRIRAIVGSVVLTAALFAAGQASAATVFGVADNHPLHDPDGGAAFFSKLQDLGLQEDRVSILWDDQHPQLLADRADIAHMLPQAAAHHVDIVLALYSANARALTANPSAPDEFAAWAAGIARAFPQVHRLIIGNEPNQPKFLQPQFLADCTPASGATYMELLAKTYDAVKAVNPNVRVVTSISPRGNDNCKASSNISTSPYKFIHDMGVEYRALNRQRPAWDEWGIHAYPNEPTDPLTKGFPWPNMGYANLDRLKQALWDAFNSTPQPTFGSTPRFGDSVAALQPLSIMIGETGWQTAIPPSARHAYYGQENVKVTSEAAQAQVYSQLVRTAGCDPTLRSVLIFGLEDEPDLDRFQSGLIRADGTNKPSYDAVKTAIAQTHGQCASGQVHTWQPTTTVVGANAAFKVKTQWWKQTWWGFTAGASEDATITGGVFRLGGKSLTPARRDAIVRGLSGSTGAGAKAPVFQKSGFVRAYWTQLVRFPSKRLQPGYYVYAAKLTATMNANRTAVFTSPAFKVTPKPLRKRRHHHKH